MNFEEYGFTEEQIETELKQYIVESLRQLYKEDYSLIERAGSERGIVANFSRYLSITFKENNFFNDLHIDVEYNRNGDKPKAFGNSKNPVIPDLIIHKREFNDNNLLIMEFKAYWNNNNEDMKKDFEKIKAFMSKDDQFIYEFGMHIELLKDKFIIREFNENGKINEESFEL